MARLLPTRVYPEPVALSVGPFTGMNDAIEPTAAADGRVAMAQNVYLAPGPNGTAYIGRPGFEAMGSQLGGAGARTVQYLGQFTKLSGTRYTVAIVGGKFYTYDWGTDTWTESVTAANFATASITLSATARVYAVPFFDTLFFTDGVNTPWTWDGSSGAGGLTECTNCPVLYGQPVVYYGKIFGIKNSDRSSMVWSEEGDATLGYETSPYSNAWTLVATGSDPLTALGARNEALSVFRERQTQRIVGAVTTDFSSAGTQADASIDTGTPCPAVFEITAGTVFVDADAGPYVLPPAGEPVSLWPWSQQTTRTIPRTQLTKVQFGQHTEQNLVWIALPEPDQTECTILLVYQADTMNLVGLWRGFTMQRVAVVRDADGTPRLIHGDTDGRIYVHGTAENGPWSDALDAGTQPVAHIVTTAPLGYDVQVEKRWTDLEFGVLSANLTTVDLSYETPRGASSAFTRTLTGGSGLLYDTGLQYDSGLQYGSNQSTDARVRAGVNGLGRWVKATIAHSVLDEQFGVQYCRVRGYETGGDPTAP